MSEVIKLTEEQAEYIEDFPELGLVLVEETDGVDEGKYITWENIYKRESDGKHFIQYNSKSGSYYSDYEFEHGTSLYEVEKVEVVKYEWKVAE